MKFDLKDYAKRQRRILSVTFVALAIFFLSACLVGLGLIQDQNTQTVLEFMSLSSSLVFAFGLLCSFKAWFDMKFMLRREKVLRNAKR